MAHRADGVHTFGEPGSEVGDMERRRALAVSVVAALMVTAMVLMGAALVQMSAEGTGTGSAAPSGLAGSTSTTATGSPAEGVVEYQDVYESVPGSPASSTGADGSGRAGAPAPVGPTGVTAGPAEASPAPAPNPVAPAAPRTTTTTAPAPATTSTTRPPGVPADWPADKPIPPMPAGCQKPQLEDNGVWNCDH